MTETISIDHQENRIFNGTDKNDVVPIQQSIMATKEPSGLNTYNDYSVLIGNSGAGGVSALSLNDKITSSKAVNTFESGSNKMVTDNRFLNNGNNIDNANNNSKLNEGENNLNNSNNNKNNNINNINNIINNKNNNNNNNNNGNTIGNHAKGRRRRKKSKQMTNSKPYKKSNWKFHSSRPSRRNNGYGLSTLVPYNTNRFLMEEHMPEITSPAGGRYRDSSFSVDSEENLYDEEEFLSKEFSNVYESARSERLDAMTKEQLIQEYLQLEASYDKLSNSLRSQGDGEGEKTSDSQQNEIKVRKLEDRMKELTAENLELRRQMADIRSRERRSRSTSRHRYTNYGQVKRNSRRHPNDPQSSQKLNHTNNNSNSSCYSEDSESDSSSSSSSGSDSSSSFSSCRSSSCSSKSSFSDAENNMSGINDDDDNDDTRLLLNGCDEMGNSDALRSKMKEDIL